MNQLRSLDLLNQDQDPYPKLSDLSKELFVEYFIAEAKRIRKSLLQQSNNSHNDSTHANQLDSFNYAQLIADYEQLKLQAIGKGLLSWEEIEGMEQEAAKQVQHKFYPLYQFIYNAELKTIQKDTTGYINNKINESKETARNFEERSGFHGFSVFVSVCVTLAFPVMLPELVISVTLMMVDIVGTAASLLVNAVKQTIAEKKEHKQIQELQQRLKAEIKSDPVINFRNRLFHMIQDLRQVVPKETNQAPSESAQQLIQLKK